MSALNVGAAALLVVSLAMTTPTLAAAAPVPLFVAARMGSGWPSLGAPSERKSKKVVKKETIAIHVPSDVDRGTKGVEITGKPSTDNRSCEMTIKWNDGTSTDVEKVRANDGRQCIFKVDVPRNAKVVGEASVAMKLTDSHGKKLASASRVMEVT